uniref:Putative secreted peptide n=1 Tax=Anopheles braziliensis TaxID=58242 RepID=A0A2M3ZV35_9DIPT
MLLFVLLASCESECLAFLFSFSVPLLLPKHDDDGDGCSLVKVTKHPIVSAWFFFLSGWIRQNTQPLSSPQ